jgi:hypothetical protein
MSRRPSLAESMKAMASAPSDAQPLRGSAEVEARELPRPAPTGGSAEVEARKFHAATREGLKKVTTAVEPAKHKQLKRLAVDSDKSVEDLLREAIDDLLAKHR